MAFEFFRSETDAAPIEKEIEAANGTTYNHGCLLVYGAGGTASTTTAKPEFVYTGKDITAKTGDKLAVQVVLPEYEWITTLSASGASLKPGNKVTTDGTQATATTASGVFELLTAGGASGAKVVGRF
jgi:hypothetical protein